MLQWTSLDTAFLRTHTDKLVSQRCGSQHIQRLSHEAAGESQLEPSGKLRLGRFGLGPKCSQWSSQKLGRHMYWWLHTLFWGHPRLSSAVLCPENIELHSTILVWCEKQHVVIKMTKITLVWLKCSRMRTMTEVSWECFCQHKIAVSYLTWNEKNRESQRRLLEEVTSTIFLRGEAEESSWGMGRVVISRQGENHSQRTKQERESTGQRAWKQSCVYWELETRNRSG